MFFLLNDAEVVNEYIFHGMLLVDINNFKYQSIEFISFRDMV